MAGLTRFGTVRETTNLTSPRAGDVEEISISERRKRLRQRGFSVTPFVEAQSMHTNTSGLLGGR